MSIFGKFERKVESAVNGVFARAFKGDVQPVEIAARLQKELDAEAKLMSRDKRLVPNEFVVGLSEHDYDKLTPYSKTLIAELAGELKTHARDMGYVFNGPIRIHFEQNTSLPTGRFTVDLGGRRGHRRTRRPASDHRQPQPGHAGARGQRHAAPAHPARVRHRPGHRRRPADQRPGHLPAARRDQGAPAAARSRSSTSARPTASPSTATRCAQPSSPRAPGSRSVPPGCWCTRPPGAETLPMSELAVTAIKVLYLALLWLFILSVVSVIRSDLFGRTVPTPGPPDAPAAGGAGAGEEGRRGRGAARTS